MTNENLEPFANDDEDMDLVLAFVEESLEMITDLEGVLLDLERDPSNEQLINQIFRLFHNLKGTSASVGLHTVKDIAHYVESLLGLIRENRVKLDREHIDLFLAGAEAVKQLLSEVQKTGKEGPKRYFDLLHQLTCKVENSTDDEQSGVKSDSGADEDVSTGATNGKSPIRVRQSALDELLLCVSDLMLLKNRVDTIQKKYASDVAFYDLSLDLDNYSKSLQNTVLSLRLSPLEQTLTSMKKVARTTAQKVGKEIEFDVYGGDTMLDRQIIDVLSDPLMHMVRNAIDHGIEDANTRALLNKPAKGVVTIHASYRAGEVHLSIRDDGKGLDPKVLKQKAVEKGLLSQASADQLSVNDAYNIIFMPGFSGASEITETSGRGVGMDVVQSTIESIGGHIDIQSQVGHGSCFTLKLPLSMAIVESLGFTVGNEAFSLPHVNVEEVYSINAVRNLIHKDPLDENNQILVVAKTPIPIIPMSRVLETQTNPSRLILLRHGKNRFAIEVDELLGTISVVTQKLPPNFAERSIFSGVTKTGDGNLQFQICINELSKWVGANSAELQNNTRDKNRGTAGNSGEAGLLTSSDIRRLQQKVAVFSNTEAMCIPVQRISRVILMDARSILSAGERTSYATIDNETVPIIWPEQCLFGRDPVKAERYHLMLFRYDDKTFAIPSAEFSGIHRLPEEYEERIEHPGILGTTILNEHTHLVIDLPKLVEIFTGYGQPTEKSASEEDNKQPLRLICAEDDRFFSAELRASLIASGYETMMFEDGLLAKEYIEKHGFENIDVIITDIEMPEMNGIDLTKWIRSRNESLPVLAYTAIRTNEMKQRAFDAGANAFVSKMDFDELLYILKKIDQGQQLTPTQMDEQNLTERLVTCKIGQNWFALNMRHIKEVTPQSQSGQIPAGDAWINSITSFRGDMIPVIDLEVLFYGRSITPEKDQAVVKTKHASAALVFSKIGDVIDESRVSYGSGMAKLDIESNLSAFISQTCTFENRVISIIDIDEVLKFCNLLPTDERTAA